MREYLLVLCIAAAVTYLLSGVCRRLALRTGALARVRDRDVHTIEMPYFGGVAMLAGVAAAILISWQLPFLGRLVTVQQDSWAVLVAAVVICLVGVLDDVFELPPLTKFAGQVFAAGIAVALGVKMLWIPLPNQIVSLDGTTSVAITVFFIVLCSNAVNFVDGLDGLATGVVGIGALAFFAYSYLLTVTEGLTRATTSSLVTVAIAGACLGFLPHNFFPGADVHGGFRRDAARSAAGHLHYQPDRSDRYLPAAGRPRRIGADGSAAGLAAGHPCAAVPRSVAGFYASHLRRQVVVPARQTAPASSAVWNVATANAARCC